MLLYVVSHACVCLEVFGAFYSYHLINHFNFPIVVYVAVATFIASGLWTGFGKLAADSKTSVILNKGSTTKFIVHGLWTLLSRFLWCTAVIYLHPLMTVLAEGVEGFVYFILSIALKWRHSQDRPHMRYGFSLAFVISSLFKKTSLE